MATTPPQQPAAYPPPPPGYTQIPQSTPVPAPGYGAPAVRYAGFWIRFVAYIIDSIIVGAVVIGVIRGAGAVVVTCPANTDLSTSCPGGVTTIQPAFWIVIAAGILYYPVLWGFGGTIGQRVLGLRVVSAMTGGSIGIGRALLRYIGYIIATIPIYLGLLWVAWDPRKQGWHDKIAGSLVIRKA